MILVLLKFVIICSLSCYYFQLQLLYINVPLRPKWRLWRYRYYGRWFIWMQDVLLKLIFQNIFWPNVYDSCHDVLQKVQVSLNKILSVKRLLGGGWGEIANFVKLCGGFGELSLVYFVLLWVWCRIRWKVCLIC